MLTLHELHLKAKQEGWAVPHFNFSSLAQLNGVIDAAKKLNAPILLGTSEGERKFVGLKQAVGLAKSFREEGLPVYLNADHTHSVEAAMAAFDAGYDSIHIDLSKLPFRENIEGTKKVVDYVKSKNPEVEVEAELGYLVTDSSKIYNEVIEIPEESYTKVEEAVEFVSETHIDRFAPAVGNMHGIALNDKVIKFDLIEKLREALPKDLTFTIHGGSGIHDEDIKKMVQMGFNNVHISTELRKAYTDALRKSLSEKPEELSPQVYEAPARAAAAELAEGKMRLYNTVNVL
ncbi:MAG: class II fructose-bisphosphate aldolase [Candidatus Levyibacteriota bacterium]